MMNIYVLLQGMAAVMNERQVRRLANLFIISIIVGGFVDVYLAAVSLELSGPFAIGMLTYLFVGVAFFRVRYPHIGAEGPKDV